MSNLGIKSRDFRLSMGIGFFPTGYPMHTMARDTSAILAAAKAVKGYDSIAFGGTPLKACGESWQADQIHSYVWKDFADGVCGEKLSFLLEQLPEGEEFLSVEESWLYSIWRLLDDTQNGTGTINLARFAHVLARLDLGYEDQTAKATYGKIRTRLYEWYQEEKDRRELKSAIKLMLYHLHETEEEV